MFSNVGDFILYYALLCEFLYFFFSIFFYLEPFVDCQADSEVAAASALLYPRYPRACYSFL